MVFSSILKTKKKNMATTDLHFGLRHWRSANLLLISASAARASDWRSIKVIGKPQIRAKCSKRLCFYLHVLQTFQSEVFKKVLFFWPRGKFRLRIYLLKRWVILKSASLLLRAWNFWRAGYLYVGGSSFKSCCSLGFEISEENQAATSKGYLFECSRSPSFQK